MTLHEFIRREGMIFTMVRDDLLAFIGAYPKGSRIEQRKAVKNPYGPSIALLERVKSTGEPIIVTERGSTDTHVIYLDYIGELWCKGHIKCLGGQEEATIPYTLRYSDLMTSDIKITEVT